MWGCLGLAPCSGSTARPLAAAQPIAARLAAWPNKIASGGVGVGALLSQDQCYSPTLPTCGKSPPRASQPCSQGQTPHWKSVSSWAFLLAVEYLASSLLAHVLESSPPGLLSHISGLRPRDPLAISWHGSSP